MAEHEAGGELEREEVIRDLEVPEDQSSDVRGGYIKMGNVTGESVDKQHANQIEG